MLYLLHCVSFLNRVSLFLIVDMSKTNRYIFKCLACGEFHRSDHLTHHYQSLVLWGHDGKPSLKKLEELQFSVGIRGKKTTSEDSKIIHTKYFLDHGHEKIPSLSKHETKSSLTPK
jgi:hypothetical protein